jgi:catechol 2,3-dioxygenase-like lactoylglutathione lyase family enzyme
MTSPLGFDGGLTAALGVTDIERSIAWYRDVLGFEPLYHLEEMGWCELRSPVERVNLGLSQREKAGGAGGAVLTFGVRDIDAARTRLEARQVRFDGPTQTIPGMVRLATFFDPDDNALMLYQDLKQVHEQGL